MNGSVLNENGFVKNRAKLFASKSEDEIDCSAAEKQRPPSYVNLSCAVSGYSGLNRYDSKVRQEIKSRESSRDRALPLCMTRSRDPSPSPSKAEFRSRVSMGFILSENKITSSLQTGPTRSKSVDRGFLRQKFLNGCLNNKPPPHSPESNSSTTSCRKSPESALNSNLLSTDSDKRGRGRFRSVTVAQDRGIAQETKKSVIQQRIERLYGPAALARGFFTVKSPQKSAKDQKTSVSLNNNNNDVVVSESQSSVGAVECCGGPPVFRHLNAEFRQQLQLSKSSTGASNSVDQKRFDQSPVKNIQPDSITAAAADPAAALETKHDQHNGTAVIVNGSAPSDQPGHQFLKILDDEKRRLGHLIGQAETYLLDASVTCSEELTGRIRAAIGKCKLLLAQKFEQFAGLCRKNLTQASDEAFPTTGQDLAGFWDMVNIQVQHIDSLFNEIQQLRDNNWNEVEIAAAPITKSAPSKKSRPLVKNDKAAVPRSAKAEEAAKAREEARRKMVEDKRRLMKEAKRIHQDRVGENVECDAEGAV